MLIKFQSQGAASFEMFSEHAMPLIQLMGLGDRKEGSISGSMIFDALSSLESRLVGLDDKQERAEAEAENKDEDLPVSMDARAFPLIEMLKHAAKNETYLMWSYK